MATFSRTTSPIKVVDVSAQPEVAKVVRNGRNVSTVQLNVDVAQSLIAPDLLDARQTQQRVLTQSVPAGQRVAKGAVIDVVLVSRDVVPMRAFEGVHDDLLTNSVEDVVQGYLINPTIKEAVENNDNFVDLPQATQDAFVSFALQQGVDVDDATPGKRSQDLFSGVKIASTYSL